MRGHRSSSAWAVRYSVCSISDDRDATGRAAARWRPWPEPLQSPWRPRPRDRSPVMPVRRTRPASVPGALPAGSRVAVVVPQGASAAATVSAVDTTSIRPAHRSWPSLGVDDALAVPGLVRSTFGSFWSRITRGGDDDRDDEDEPERASSRLKPWAIGVRRVRCAHEIRLDRRPSASRPEVENAVSRSDDRRDHGPPPGPAGSYSHSG